jgi:DNA-binding PadR family transcriptional regulator
MKADWRNSETGREAKYYSLTREGTKQLAAENQNWNRLAEAIRLVMQTAE